MNALDRASVFSEALAERVLELERELQRWRHEATRQRRRAELWHRRATEKRRR